VDEDAITKECKRILAEPKRAVKRQMLDCPFLFILEPCTVLFDCLSNDENPEIAQSAKRMNEKLTDDMRMHNQRDAKRARAEKKAQERFE